MIEILDFADKFLSILPQALAAGEDVLAMIAQQRVALGKMKAESRGPTTAEWDALDNQINDLMGKLK